MNAEATHADQPGERRAAPGPLALVQSFANTRDIEAGTDALSTPAALCDWLRDAGLIASRGRASDADLRAATNVREAIRTLLVARREGGSTRQAWTVLNRAVDAAQLTLRFSPETQRPRLEPRAGGVAAALGSLVAIVAAAIDDGTWLRLKACRRDACRWVFYDNSPAQAGVWCAMSICGNRTKARRHRERCRTGDDEANTATRQRLGGPRHVGVGRDEASPAHAG